MHLDITATLPAPGVRSLVWHGDSLIDWVAGGVRYELDGQITAASVIYSYRFDAACASPSREHVLLYERCGTKGVLLKKGEILREINRSFYHAGVYEFPACFARIPSGQEVLIHCPDDYNQLDIEDLDTGKRLTDIPSRKPADFFHSRLAASPQGNHFLSAGWVWHPFDMLSVFNLEESLQDPKGLDGPGNLFPGLSTAISSATFVDEQRLVLATCDETFLDDDELSDDSVLRPNSIALWSLEEAKIISQATLSELAGTLMTVDSQFVIGFHQNPKLINIKSGEVVSRLENLDSGKQLSSIIHHIDALPPLALDADHQRFALATENEIIVGGVVSD